MTPLAGLIAAEIAAHGPMPVDRYMELALQHPDYGYYRQAAPIGRAGDFITAPEISQMFGEMLGLWCALAWQGMGSPKQFVLLELGPGHGTLMRDALRATRHVTGFHDALRLCMLENHSGLQEKQREAVIPVPVQHVSDLSALPPSPLIFIANEFFDALPVRQYVRRGDAWSETRIDHKGDAFAFSHKTVEPPIVTAQAKAVYETCPAAHDIMGQLVRHMRLHGGAGVVADYGYETPPEQSTLQAVQAHQKVDFLSSPGQVDLTALVDFAALSETAKSAGAAVISLGGQGDFLRGMGIERRAAQLKQKATPQQALDIDHALHRLTDDAEMGTLFRVMTLSVIL
ncbi:MAG: SAM-dependent methyltransferase [Alphaproteobacteria bacterium]|nr:SAM-dependent methyltransferase [Alphaproteobacteria bacterium]MBV8549599.1 SAM-dependent methyltransferase [Alphaproteobacteria bacterium]